MFVHPVRRWAQGVSFVLGGAVALLGCEDPDALTDLRPEGPPVVLSVTVANDPDGYLETATYCRPNDPKRPTFVALIQGEVCSGEDPAAGAEQVTDAIPTNPYVRIQFDELLDNKIETLTQVMDPDTGEATGVFTGTIIPQVPGAPDPVTLNCGGTVIPYDGYYQPAGNSVTWPLGPSLVVFPVDASAVAAGSTCTVTLNTSVVVDKQGEGTTDSEAFTFGVAALEFSGSDPEVAEDPADAAVVTPESVATLLFNGFVDPSTLAPGEVILRTVTSCETPTTVATRTAEVGGDVGAIEISDAGVAGDATFQANTSYVIEFAAGAEVEDAAGATLALPPASEFSLCFVVDAA